MLWSTTAVWRQVAPLGCQCGTGTVGCSRFSSLSKARNLGKQAKSEALAMAVGCWQLAFAREEGVSISSGWGWWCKAARRPQLGTPELHCIAHRTRWRKQTCQGKSNRGGGRPSSSQQQHSLTGRGRQMMGRLQPTWPSSRRLE